MIEPETKPESMLTYERMLKKTGIYSRYTSFYCEQLQTWIEGWWMSKKALNDGVRLEWLN
jgi:hypothetical protein